jgi:hypothetical protein
MDHCRPNGVDCYPRGVELRESALTSAKWSNITYAVGAAGLGAAAYLYFSGHGQPSDESKRARRPQRLTVGIAPSARGRGGAAVVQGAF